VTLKRDGRTPESAGWSTKELLKCKLRGGSMGDVDPETAEQGHPEKKEGRLIRRGTRDQTAKSEKIKKRIKFLRGSIEN